MNSNFATIQKCWLVTFNLAVSEIKVRYKQSVFGYGWALAKPLSLALVFTFLFQSISKLNTDGVPYFIYVFAGVLCWDLFSSVINTATNSIVKYRQIIERFNYPRLLFPCVGILSSLFDFFIGIVVFAFFYILFGTEFRWEILLLPLCFVYIIAAGFCIGVWTSALTVWFRDIRYITQYLLQILMLISPIGFSPENIPNSFGFINYINPVLPAIELVRYCLFGSTIESVLYSSICLVIMLLFTALGVFNFQKLQGRFLDVL